MRGAEFLARLGDLLLPTACAGCKGWLPQRSAAGGRVAERRVCPECVLHLRSVPHPRCPRCGAPQGSGRSPDSECRECAEWVAGLASAQSGFLLRPPADALIHALKYEGWPELAGEMADLLLRTLPPGWKGGRAGVLVPMPTTPARLRQRGYNQAERLASALSDRIGVRMEPWLARREKGGSQTGLSRLARSENVQGAFHLALPLAPEDRRNPVLLVDDVLTTGATACAAAGALLEGGFTEVHLLTFARALPGRN